MLRFRDHWPIPSEPLSPSLVREVASRALDPTHFQIVPPSHLEREFRPEVEQRWEVFRGRLLDPAHTRQMETFEEWNLYLIESQERPPEPLISLKLDTHRGELHVVRAILCHVWEGYDSGGGVMLSREATRWVRELVETIALNEMSNTVELLDELSCAIYRAVVGSSRLPLTSVETPMPAFTLGQLAYEPPGDTIGMGERAKRLESLLHRKPLQEIDSLGIDRPLETLTTMFNEVSLSPWTDLAEKALCFLDSQQRRGLISEAKVLDFLSSLVVQLGRHLTAYDLITFHHRGANYPDALFLDLLIKELLRRVEATPTQFEESRLRRRALRQGWLHRRFYEGLPVPDAPTSPGENQRVLPLPHVRVPEEQILQPNKRRRQLYADDPLSAHLGPNGERLLRQSLDDLSHLSELREMGLALFLDRPLGAAKSPGEPDRTILLSHRAFSPSVAQRRLNFMREKLGMALPMSDLPSLSIQGISLEKIGGQPRPGAVSVADARQVAPDFLFLQTTSATVGEFFEQYDFAAHPELTSKPLLIVPRENGILTIHDEEMRPLLELKPDFSKGYGRRAGRELVRAGLQTVSGVIQPRLLSPPTT